MDEEGNLLRVLSLNGKLTPISHPTTRSNGDYGFCELERSPMATLVTLPNRTKSQSGRQFARSCVGLILCIALWAWARTVINNHIYTRAYWYSCSLERSADTMRATSHSKCLAYWAIMMGAASATSIDRRQNSTTGRKCIIRIKCHLAPHAILSCTKGLY